MRHQVSHRKLSRSMSHRRALLRSLVTALVKQEQIRTTLPKAKELRPLVEKFVTMARKDTLHNRRQAYSYIFDKAAVQKLFNEIAPRFKTRNGGYTRIVRTDFRKGDAAEMAIIEFVEKGATASKSAATEVDSSDDKETKAKTTEATPKKAKKPTAKSASTKSSSKITKTSTQNKTTTKGTVARTKKGG